MTIALTGKPAGGRDLNAALLAALKEAAITVVLIFLLSIFLVGFHTQADQGQPLGYVTRFGDVAWACILVPAGRSLITLDRLGWPRPALFGGTAAFLYLFGLGLARVNSTVAYYVFVACVLFSLLLKLVNAALARSARSSAAPAEFVARPAARWAKYALLFVLVVIVEIEFAGPYLQSFAAIVAIPPLPFGDPMVDIIFGLGAVYIFAIAYSGSRSRRHGALTLEEREAKETRRAHLARNMSGIIGPILIGMAVAIPIVMPFSPWSNASRQVVDTLVLVLTYVMLGWGLNIVVGLAGLLDLGYVAFYAVGAYTYAKLSTEFGFGFWTCLPFAGIMSAVFGVALGFPVLRLRGDYLAIVTLGFGEMIRIVLINWQWFTGGPAGIGEIEKITFFGLPFERHAPAGHATFAEFFGLDFSTVQRVYFLYYVILVLALITNFVTIRLRRLPIGRAWEALREDETACRALGINPTNTKLTAFAMGAMFAGFAGSFFASRQGFVSPESFVFIESAQILAIVVLGGMGSQVGVALAAILLIGLPEVMRELALYRMLFYGMCMVMIMVLRPRGLLAHREPTILLKLRRGGATK
jgi:branched-chain amino acid transport system permease protein